MTAFLHVGLRPAPVLGEEQREAMTSPVDVVGRIQRPEHRVGHHAFVERINQFLEEGHATDGLVQGHAM
jgi:hypothetical protein